MERIKQFEKRLSEKKRKSFCNLYYIIIDLISNAGRLVDWLVALHLQLLRNFRPSIILPSAYQEKVPAKNAIYAHAHGE
jgi:hypothetical protein